MEGMTRLTYYIFRMAVLLHISNMELLGEDVVEIPNEIDTNRKELIIPFLYQSDQEKLIELGLESMEISLHKNSPKEAVLIFSDTIKKMLGLDLSISTYNAILSRYYDKLGYYPNTVQIVDENGNFIRRKGGGE